MSHKSKPILPTMILEAPAAAEAQLGTSELLLSPDSIAPTLSKLGLVESLLRLTVRDCSFKDFCSEALLNLMRVIKCEAGSIFEIDEAHGCLVFRSSVGQSSHQLKEFSIPLGKGIVGHVAESGTATLVDDVSANTRHLKSIQDAVGYVTRNLIAVPITVRAKRYGVLELLNRVGESSFTKADLDLATYYCQMFSKSLEARMLISGSQLLQRRHEDQVA